MAEVVRFPPLLGLSQRLPPSNLQAEQALLGGILSNARGFHAVSAFLRPEHFADPIHGAIYAAAGKRISRGGLADPIMLKADFEGTGVLDEVGGTAYLGNLLAAAVSTINGAEYGRVIFQSWQRRCLIDLGEQLVNGAFDPDAELSDTYGKAITGLDAAVLGTDGGHKPVSLDGAVDAALDAYEVARTRKGPAGIATGFAGLDERIGGMEPGTLHVLAGRPSMGKSALGWQIAINAARQGVGVLAVSLEMSAVELGRRALAAVARVPVWRMRRGMLLDGQAEALVVGRKELRGLPLTIEDGAGLTASQIGLAARSAARKCSLGLIMVDHLHIVRPEDADIRQGPTWAIGRISGAMKRLAKDHGCPVLLLAQLNRAVEGRDDKRPQLQDLRQSGDIEQDADSASFIYRAEYYLGKAPPEQKADDTADRHAARVRQWYEAKDRCAGKAEVLVEKVRDGEAGVVPMLFDGETTSFSEAPAHE